MPKISMCGNDLELAPGFCGSISGSVNVTVGQPHIKVDSITVGGRQQMNSREITSQISKAADFLNLKKWDYGASFSNDYSVQVDKGEAKQLKASQKQILTIRVWNQSNLVGITTTSDICLLYTSPSPRDRG